MQSAGSCVTNIRTSRPPIDSIDFFENTLNIRKDAIRPYDNYNPQEEEEAFSVTLGDFKEGGAKEQEQEAEFHNRFLVEECPPPYQPASGPDPSLQPVTLAMMMEDTAEVRPVADD